MSDRTAQISRKTGETDVSLTLGLDGSGSGSRRTGVGFLDHMLDLLARHGRLDLELAVTGDLETGAHHTVEDTGIVFGQALDRALGDRAGITRYGAARFASGLTVRHFRRTLSEVRIGAAGPELAAAAIPIAEAEGFDRHARSMALRQNQRS